MRCPYCGSNEDKVIDSREASDGAAIRRRRECLKCQRRTTTYERLEEPSLLVVKRDGRREPFDRKKILAGIQKACEKRPVPAERIESLVDEIEREMAKEFEKEVSSVQIGERVIQRLSELDEVAYVRFASVYRSFKDINQFMKELRELLNKKQS
ncbi:MAG: transcriptional repressor NrdR [Candidatus Omnitrophica bacterium]|nr:transcriptional repressor NrdR [Candidatus Omnitrophota bacterium]